MRQLILMRHAEASYAGVGQSDFDRPLTSKGIEGAIAQANWLKTLKIMPDHIIASPALRTKTTAEIVTGQLKPLLSIDFSVLYQEFLYNCSSEIIAQTLKDTAENIDILMIVGHNPGIHETALRLADPIADQPPSSLAIKLQGGYPPASLSIFDFTGRHWREISHQNMTLRHFITP